MPVARYLCIFINVGLGEGSALPVGVPVPWPSATPPTGWLKCNGAAFSAEEYPELAKVYPTNKLPDLRGEFIRGWDDGMGRFFFHVMGALAEMERELIVERTKAGLEAARAQGRIGGRRPKLTPEQWAQAGRLIASGVPRQKVAIIYDVGISTLYKKFPVGDK